MTRAYKETKEVAWVIVKTIDKYGWGKKGLLFVPNVWDIWSPRQSESLDLDENVNKID